MCSINNSLVQDSNLNNSTGHQFALCESCFWSATIFKSKQKNVHINNSCPVCSNSNISLNPLAKDEAYELHV